MQVKNATAALSTASNAGGKASVKANGAEDQGFAALMSVLGAPLSEASSETSAQPTADEGEQGQGGATAGDENAAFDESSDLERATAVSSVSPIAAAPMPVAEAQVPVAPSAAPPLRVSQTVTSGDAMSQAFQTAPRADAMSLASPLAPRADATSLAFPTAPPADEKTQATQIVTSADATPQVAQTATTSDPTSQVAVVPGTPSNPSPFTSTEAGALQTSSAPAVPSTRGGSVQSTGNAATVGAQPQSADAASSTDSAPSTDHTSLSTSARRPSGLSQPSVEREATSASSVSAQPASSASQADGRLAMRPAGRFTPSQRFEAWFSSATQPSSSIAAPAPAALPLAAFHVEQLAVTPVAGPYAPVNPLASAAVGRDAMWDAASLPGARVAVAGGRPGLDALQNLGLEMQGVVRGGLRAAMQASRFKAGSDPSRDSRADAAAALAATTAPPQTAEGGIVSNNAPVPLPSLVPEVVRTAAELSDAFKKGNPAASNVVELRLDPPALGAITVRVVEEQGVVNAYVTCANPAMQKVLAAEMTHLSTNLAHHGIALGQVSVGTDGGGGQQFGHKPDAAETEIAPTGRRAPPPVAAAQSRAAPRSALFQGRAVNTRA